MSSVMRLALAGCLAAAGAAGADELGDSFRADLAQLTSRPHRLAGTDAAVRASRYVQQRLRRIGLKEVYVQNFPVAQCRPIESVLVADGNEYPVYQMRPNLLQGVVTPAEGLTAKTVYAGGGSFEEYTAHPLGRIVVLEYSAAGERWLPAFAMGAKAVVFIGSEAPAFSPHHHVNFPAMLPRFYVPAEVADRLGLRKAGRKITLRAACRWEMLEGRNVIGVIRGTDPVFDLEKDEALLLSAPLDSFSEVPALSRGARGAANAAALLQLAEYFHKTPPRRDVILCFFDAEALNHDGARAFYGSLYRKRGRKKYHAKQTLDERLKMFRAEQAFIDTLQKILDKGNIFTHDVKEMDEYAAAAKLLEREARGLVGVIRDELQMLRLTRLRHDTELKRFAKRGAPTTRPAWREGRKRLFSGWTKAQHEAAIERLNEQIGPLEREAGIRSLLQRWVMDDEYPKVLAKGKDEEIAKSREVLNRYEPLLAAAEKVCADRRKEIDVEIRCLKQGLALSEAMGEDNNLIVLHLAMNLGDASGRWTFIHGGDSPVGSSGAGNIGEYATSVFRAAEDVAKAPDFAGRIPLFESRTVDSLHHVRMFAPGKFTHAGGVGGLFAVPNLALMTPVDRMERDGQPQDVVTRPGPAGRAVKVLRDENIIAAMREIPSFLHRLADSPALSVKTGIKASSAFSEATFSSGRYKGSSALMISGGSPMPDRPARGAFVALVSEGSPQLWGQNPVNKMPPGFRPFSVIRVDVNGKFQAPPLNRGQASKCLVFGAMFDPRGMVQYVTSQETVRGTSNTMLDKREVVLFRAVGMTIVGMGYDRRGIATKALKAGSTSMLNPKDSLTCEVGNLFTVYAWWGTYRLKIFNKYGMVILGNAPPVADPVVGEGMEIGPFEHWPANRLTAQDLTVLNKARRELLKKHKIYESSLERLGAEADELRARAKEFGQVAEDAEAGGEPVPAGNVARQVGARAAAGAFSRREYGPLLSVINDLVLAVVLLLLLSIPFAYALERLLVGSPHIYRQILWFVAFFILTFVALFVVNPAFRIAATPVIIFLAFGIIVLSALVIIIMSRKLQTEVRRMQGLGTTVHSADVSRLGTMMAAVHMGISTMRRRPIRTMLTAVTVLLLTFTILTFASFTSSWGTRRTSVGPLSGPPRLMVRHPFWGSIYPDSVDVLAGLFGPAAEVVPRYWVALTAGEVEAFATNNKEQRFMIAADPGAEAGAGRLKLAEVSALVGVDVRDARRMPQLREVLQGDTELLATNGVFLTPDLAGEGGLRLRKGQTVYVAGIKCVLAGFLDRRKVTAYRTLEGSNILPVDYETSGGGKVATLKQRESRPAEDMPETESARFVTFGPDQVAVVSAEIARRLGGRLASISVHPTGDADLRKMGQQVAKITALPTYVGTQGGVERLFFTSLTRASGWKDLLIPVVLGGLIIFATLLGSVSDREKEIYAFSALGLAPPHVASLFFAEASVYAVVGGMGGYLLGQTVARTVSWLNEVLGTIAVPTMNYSSTNAVVTIVIVMCTVLISTIFPAVRASRSANPGIQRHWRIGKPDGDRYDIVFPFTVSSYDITGVVSFLAEHFQNFSDSALGTFASSDVQVFRQGDEMLGLRAQVALAPFDLGVSQEFALLAQPSEIEGIEEIRILLRRLSGTRGDWRRSNRVFIKDLRKQLLIWRSVTPEIMERYRQRTLEQWRDLPVEDIRPETFGGAA